MEILKTISILLPILVILSGAGIYLFNWYAEPNFENAQYYTTAWMEYGVNENTLNIEVEPDLNGNSFAAAGEALHRVVDKSDINSKIDGKPIIIKEYVRQKAGLVYIGKTPVTAKDVEIFEHGTVEEKAARLRLLAEKTEINESLKELYVVENGHLVKVRLTNDTFSANASVEDFLDRKEHGEIGGYARRSTFNS